MVRLNKKAKQGEPAGQAAILNSFALRGFRVVCSKRAPRAQVPMAQAGEALLEKLSKRRLNEVRTKNRKRNKENTQGRLGC